MLIINRINILLAVIVFFLLLLYIFAVHADTNVIDNLIQDPHIEIDPKFPILHARNGKTLRVMVVDTGVDVDSYPNLKKRVRDKYYSKFSIDYVDRLGHGTAVSNLIMNDVCDDVELESCNYYDGGINKVDESIKCYRRAIDKGFDVINYSSTGNSLVPQEMIVMEELKNDNITFFTVSGNEGKRIYKVSQEEVGEAIKQYTIKNHSTPYFDDVGDFLPKGRNYTFPASFAYDNMVVVGGLGADGRKSQISNWGWPIHWALGVDVPLKYPHGKQMMGSGTSFAVAIYLNRRIKDFCSELHKGDDK